MPTVEGYSVWWRATHPDDIAVVERELADADRAELQVSGLTLQNAVAAGMAIGGLTFTMLDYPADRRPMGLMGVAPIGSDFGAVWAVTTPAVRKHRVRFHRISKQWIEWAHCLHPILGNVVWAGNLGHILWLQRLGFSFLAEHEINGALYYEFARVGPQCATQ